jgi:hypothetical protein
MINYCQALASQLTNDTELRGAADPRLLGEVGDLAEIVGEDRDIIDRLD